MGCRLVARDQWLRTGGASRHVAACAEYDEGSTDQKVANFIRARFAEGSTTQSAGEKAL